MLWRRKVAPQEINELRAAAVHLFGLKQAASHDFWKTLKMEQVKRAFREKARLFHPDLHGQARPEALKLKEERFIVARNSYEVLKRFLGADVFKHFG